MSQSFESGAGNKVFCYVALLPLKDRTEPVDVTVTCSAGITSGATTIAVTALTGPIAGGTPLVFENTSNDRLLAYLEEDAKLGATSIAIAAATAALTGSCEAEYIAKTRILGGTQATETINQNRTETQVFEDLLGFTDGVPTSRSWEVPWQGNFVPGDLTLQRIIEGLAGKDMGREVYVWLEYNTPVNGVSGIEGAAMISNYQKSYPSNGIITVQWTFMGNGSPKIIKPTIPV
jgi:hypothetical protein